MTAAHYYPRMTDLPDVIPRDDRAWPRGSVVLSVVIGLAAVGAGVGLVVGAAGRGSGVMLVVLAGFVVAFGFALAVFGVAFRHRITGRPVPGRLQVLTAVPAFVAVGVLYGVDGSAGGAMLAGLIGGGMVANLRAIRAARANREIVEAAEAALARDQAATSVEAEGAPLPYGSEATPCEPVGQVLHEAVARERRRWLAWLVAGGVVTAAGVVLGAPGAFMFGVAFLGALPVVWVTRRLWGVWLARRDFAKAAAPPRRAFVVLLADPTPGTMRPLLGIWLNPPVVRGGRMQKPEEVYRCGDEHDVLECHQGSVVVHEAWVDTGPRPTSKPRWVAADAGIALPHRRALLLGPWYMSSLIRGERPGRPVPLTRRAPNPDTEAPFDARPDHGSFPVALAWRLAVLAAAGLIFSWLA